MNNDISKSALRAWQIFPILVKCAQSRQTITYGELNMLLGYKDGKNTSLGTKMLSFIQEYCRQKREEKPDYHYPLLTSIVVNKSTRIPGSGQITVSDAKNPNTSTDYKQVLRDIEEVFEHNWTPDDYPENFADPRCFEEIGKKCTSKN